VRRSAEAKLAREERGSLYLERRTMTAFRHACTAVAFVFASVACTSDTPIEPPPTNDQLNNPPVISALTVEPELVEPSGTATIVATASDPDGDALTYSWSVEAGTITGTGSTVDWTAPTASAFYSLSVVVNDGKGGTASASTDVAVRGFTLLVADRDGLTAFDEMGSSFLLSGPLPGFLMHLETSGTRIFAGNPIRELDHYGAVIREIATPPEVGDFSWLNFVVLPDNGFALLNNVDDLISFVDATGAFVAQVAMPVDENDSWQNVHGTFVEDQLLVSETGTSKVLSVDATTHEVQIFRDLSGSHVNLSDIEYGGGRYYLALHQEVLLLPEEGGYTPFVDLSPDFNITGLEVVGDHLYTVLNFAGKIYKTNVNTRATEVFAEGLVKPFDLEFYPVSLRQP
jgi:hypothetical protein